jgi:hypothetical protein
MEYLSSIVSLMILVVILVLEVRRPSNVIPVEEKIAYIKRILENLTPLTLLLVTDAEIQFGRGSGQFKRSYVLNELYKRIPDEYKKYITEDNLDVIINTSLPKAESLWADGPRFLENYDMGIRK